MEIKKNYEELLSTSRKYALDTYPSPLEKFRFDGIDIYLKRDDKLDLGSSKQRSLIIWIEKYLQKGHNKFSVATSGNSGIVSLFLALKNPSIEIVKVFLSTKISDEKLARFISLLKEFNIETNIQNLRKNLKLKNIDIKFCDNPKQEAFLCEKQGFVNLRGSTDELAVQGFETIANEIAMQTNEVFSVYIPASSGTTAKGIFKGFKNINLKPKINIIQTTKTNALLRRINSDFTLEEKHPAEAIIDIIGHRRIEIEKILKLTKGINFIINSHDCIEAHKTLKENGIETGFDSALTFAAWKKTKEPSAILMFSGK